MLRGMRQTPRSAPALAGLLVLIGLAAACGQVRVAERHQVPFTATTMSVERVIERGYWLEVTLLSPRLNRLFYFARDEPCREILEQGTEIPYRRTGGFGFVAKGELRCDVAGIGQLRQWRGSRVRAGTGTSRARPRRRANYRSFWSDEEIVMLRGDFPLATMVSWPRADDTIAVFKREERCSRTLERGSAFIEFNPNGPSPLILVQEGGGCALEGLIRPGSAQGTSR